MLRCPPSRINLTSTDIIDFEVRYNARQSARAYARQRANVRLSPGPDHFIGSAITTKEENHGRQQTASSSSQATVCSAQEYDASIGVSTTHSSCHSEIHGGGAPSDIQDLADGQVVIQTESIASPESILGRILSPKKLGKQAVRGSPPNTAGDKTCTRDERAAENGRGCSSNAVLDGARDTCPAVCAAPHRGDPNGMTPACAGRSILGEIDSDAYPSSHKTLPQLPPILPALSSARARRRYTRSHDTSVHQDPPIHQLPTQERHARELNPDAPAFVPQTRLGRDNRSSSGNSVAVRGLEPRWNSLDSSHSSSSLRLRSSSEQNVDSEASQRAEHRRSRPLPPIPARHRLSNEHSNLALRPSPHLERYPVLRPPTRPPVSHRRRSSRVQARPPTPSARRVPSMVSAASGISSSLSSRRASVEGLDAAAEFLRMRSSPLDELTERISRVAASRQRSVGRSFERPPVIRHRISLLSGDLFRQDATVVPAAPQSAVAVELSRPSTATVIVDVAPAESTAEDAVPHRSMPAGSPPREITPSSPSTPLDSSTEPDARSPLAQKSPSKAVEPSSSAVKRKPLPTESMTPRMPVYDDSKPPGIQPRTPADIPPSARSRPQHADALAARSPAPATSPTTAVNPMTMALQVTTAMGTPPSIPERHAHRPAHQGATPRPRRPQAAHASVTSHGENDLDGQMSRHPELEGDRRTWVSRREEGSLESTPPREGRFEQYLS